MSFKIATFLLLLPEAQDLSLILTARTWWGSWRYNSQKHGPLSDFFTLSLQQFIHYSLRFFYLWTHSSSKLLLMTLYADEPWFSKSACLSKFGWVVCPVTSYLWWICFISRIIFNNVYLSFVLLLISHFAFFYWDIIDFEHCNSFRCTT